MKKILFAITTILLGVPLAAFAEDGPISALMSGNAAACGSGCVAPLLNGLFMASLSVGAMLAVLRIGYAGWLYMGSADMWSTKGHAIQVFQDAIIGLLVLLGVWLILFQINPDILELDFTRSFNAAAKVSPSAQGPQYTNPAPAPAAFQ